jgi:radical SAM superfamily enzyme YgiQ (UPF0313 family)
MKKQVLMITPESPRIKSHRRWQFNNFVQLTMPYLAGFVDPGAYEIVLIDEYNQRIPWRCSPNLVAITVNTPNANHCYQISRRFQDRGAYVVAGGPHVTLLPEEARRHFNTIVIGEAEETWPRFLADFEQGRPQSVYSSDHTPSLAKMPIPRRDLIGRRSLAGSVIATRGCRHACSYCCLKQLYHAGFRVRPIPEVLEDIGRIRSRYFVFWDDSLFSDPAYAKELLRSLVPLRRRWAAQVTLASCRDEELLRLAKESGCLYLFVGLESFSNQGLASVNKTVNRTEDYREIVGLIHRHGLCVQAGIIFGLDTDDVAIFADTLRACEDIGIDGATVSLLTPLPGTPLYEQMSRAGRLTTSDWSQYDGKTAVAFVPQRVTAQQLLDGYLWFRKRFYSWRSIFRRLAVSRTHLLHNLIINLGYRLSIPTGLPCASQADSLQAGAEKAPLPVPPAARPAALSLACRSRGIAVGGD